MRDLMHESRWRSIAFTRAEIDTRPPELLATTWPELIKA